jgi:hypothetical protein
MLLSPPLDRLSQGGGPRRGRLQILDETQPLYRDRSHCRGVAQDQARTPRRKRLPEPTTHCFSASIKAPDLHAVGPRSAGGASQRVSYWKQALLHRRSCLCIVKPDTLLKVALPSTAVPVRVAVALAVVRQRYSPEGPVAAPDRADGGWRPRSRWRRHMRCLAPPSARFPPASKAWTRW